jgi:type I restriction enzyme, S subunit
MSQVELTTLGKSCEFFNGKAHEKSIDENGKYIVVNSKFISQEGRVVKRTKEQMFPLYKGDIVMVMSDVPNGKALAKCFIIDQDDNYSLNQRICCIRSKEFDTKYLYYQLNRNEHFLAFNNGENQTNLRKDDILDCPLIKPSMEEQKRMVSELDLAFSELEKVNRNLSDNILNAKSIYQSELNRIFTDKGKNWETKLLKEVCEKITDGTHQTPKYFDSGYIFLSSRNVTSGFIDWDNIKYIDEKQHLEMQKRVSPKIGDILLAKNGTTGVAAMVDRDVTFDIYVSLAWLRSKGEVLPEFLLSFVNSPIAKKQFNHRLKGIGVPNLHLEEIREVEISYPKSKDEQINLVKYFNLLLSKSKALEEKYTLKLEKIEELKSGILKRAFENELVEAE